jgi:hypothetical protein
VLPDLGLFVSIVTLFYCLFLYDGAQRLFRDSDTGWHIRTGEAILTSGTLPRTDPFSFSKSAEPWFAWEWGSEVLMGLAHRTAGLPGVAALFLIAIAACTWLWFRLHWAVRGDFFIACLMVSPMLSTANLHWLARPHVFSWLFLLSAVLYAEKAGGRFTWRNAAVVALGSAAWANMHATFFLAPVLAVLYALGALVRPYIWQSEGVADRLRFRWFVLASLVSAAGSFLNPYGFRLHSHLLAYLRNSELLARIGEFQSFNFHSDGSMQIMLMVGLASAGAVLAFQQGRVANFLLIALWFAVSLRSARALPVLALIALPLANGAITAALREAKRPAERARRRLASVLAYSGRLRTIDAGLNGALVVPLALLALFAVLRTPAVQGRVGFPADEFPVTAAQAVDKLPESARLLAPDKYGGYLIYRFAGRRKVFMDGRSDFYGLDFMKRYVELLEVRPGWRSIVKEYGFTHALLPKGYSLVPALDQAGWRRLHEDDAAVLFEAPPQLVGGLRVLSSYRLQRDRTPDLCPGTRS